MGNADGEGRPGLTGTDAAAPLMFDIFSQLENKPWFQQPRTEMKQVVVCSQSGQRSTPLCHETETTWITEAGLQSPPCPYHKLIHLSADGRYRVHSGCERVDHFQEVSWFILPPTQDFYYRSRNTTAKTLPPFRQDCIVSSPVISMDLIYPKPNAKILIPRELDGNPGNAVFELAHRNPSATVHWHLDGSYLGSTQKRHNFSVNPSVGKHTLVLVDENGEALEEHFEVLSKM